MNANDGGDAVSVGRWARWLMAVVVRLWHEAQDKEPGEAGHDRIDAKGPVPFLGRGDEGGE